MRPILAANCYDCHTDEEKGGLRLDSREALLKGGESGPAIVPGDPAESLLIQAVRQDAGAPKMPKGKSKLKPGDIDVLVEWVRAGAPWPASSKPAPRRRVLRREMAVTAEHRKFWSISRSRRTSRSCGQGQVVGEDRHRSVHPGAARKGRAASGRPRPTSSRCCDARRSI